MPDRRRRYRAPADPPVQMESLSWQLPSPHYIENDMRARFGQPRGATKQRL